MQPTKDCVPIRPANDQSDTIPKITGVRVKIVDTHFGHDEHAEERGALSRFPGGDISWSVERATRSCEHWRICKSWRFFGIAISLLISGFKAGDGGVGCNNGVNYYEIFLIFSLQRKTGKERHICASNVVPEFLPPLVQSPPEVCKTRDQVCEVNENRH